MSGSITIERLRAEAQTLTELADFLAEHPNLTSIVSYGPSQISRLRNLGHLLAWSRELVSPRLHIALDFDDGRSTVYLSAPGVAWQVCAEASAAVAHQLGCGLGEGRQRVQNTTPGELAAAYYG